MHDPLPANSFGDHFDIHSLPLYRQATGYAVQLLDTDQLLDRQRETFLPIRSAELDALFPDFAAAHLAASRWVRHHCPSHEHSLSIVPASYDPQLSRHILIYGVLCSRP